MWCTLSECGWHWSSMIKFKNCFINPKRVDYIQKLDPHTEGIYRILISVGGTCLYEICSSQEEQDSRFEELKNYVENA